MLVGKQMVLTILIISIALGTETEFQMVSIFLCTSANRAFMAGRALLSLLYASLVGLSSVYLFR